MKKYNVEVLLTNGKKLAYQEIEAADEEAAISKIKSSGDSFVYFKKDESYYKINKFGIVGYEVTPWLSPEEKTERAKDKLLGN